MLFNDGEIVVGRRVVIVSTPEPVRLLTKPGAVLELGDDVRIGSGTTIAAFGRVRLGRGVRIGARCLVLDDQSAAGIVIEDGATIEDEVTLVAGAHVAAGARVARGSLVTAHGAASNGAGTRASAAPPSNDLRPAEAGPLAAMRDTVARVLPDAATAPADADLHAVTDWTSLAMVQLTVALEERFGVVLADGTFDRHRTLDALTAHVEQLRDAAAHGTGERAPAPSTATRWGVITGPFDPLPRPAGRPTSRSATSRLRAELRALRGVASRSTVLVAVANALPRWTLQHLRVWLLRAAGCQIASGSAFLGEVALIGPTGAASLLAVEAGCVVAPGVTFGLDARIELGRNVSIGPGATLYTGTHHVGPHGSRMDPSVVARPVVVEDGAWIGMAALILPGVRVGAGAVVSAGAVVTTDVPPDTLVAGNPAAVVRSLPG